jgi:hypothetical protein
VSRPSCDAVFATAVASPRGDVAVLYFRRSRHHGQPLVLVDFDVTPLSATTWLGINGRLRQLAEDYRAGFGSLGVWVEGEALLAAAIESGMTAWLVPPVISTKAAWGELTMTAMVQARRGAVGYADAVFDKRDALAETVPFGALKPAMAERSDDASVPAMLYGIAIGLDTATARLARRPA